MTHLYTQAGIYTVTLLASDGVVTNTLTQVNYITALQPNSPQADFSGTPLSGSLPLTVTFTNSSTQASSYLWDFGDGASSTETNPTHVYTQPGAYTVTLVAGDGVVSYTLTRPAYVGVALDWWAKVQASIRQTEYFITWQDRTYLSDVPQAYHAPNRAHNLRTYFTPRGIRMIARTGDPSAWNWGLRLSSYGYADELQAVGPAELVVQDNGVAYRRGSRNQGQPGKAEANLTEWYINNESGLEQGFTLSAPPPSKRKSAQADSLNDPATNTRTKSEIHLELDLSGNLKPELLPDGSAIIFQTPAGKAVLRYGDLFAYDATGQYLPTRMELTKWSIRLIVEDTTAVYPITIDPLASSPAWTAESNVANSSFGVSVGTAGDVDGNGYSDVIVGAYQYDNGQADTGAAFVYYGSANGLPNGYNWSALGTELNGYFGFAVGTAGDVDGNGYSDVIVGAYQYGANDPGAAFVYYGGPNGLDAAPTRSSQVLNSAPANAGFGVSVGTAGDVNRDGYSDVIVGANLYDNGQTDEGAAFVYYGPANGVNITPWKVESNQVDARLGRYVGTAGDVNGDGYADIIIGAPRYDISLTDEGAAFVYYGSANGLNTTSSGSGLSISPNWTKGGAQANANLGIAVGTAGDVNGDGYSDVIIGAYWYDNGQTDEGIAVIVHGSASGLNPTVNRVLESNQADALFGYPVGTAGDVNGDGYADVIVGAYRYDNGQTDTGGAFIYNGSLLIRGQRPRRLDRSEQPGQCLPGIWGR